MPKMIICQGIPCSGKSTGARDFIEQNNNWIRVNRDDIRRMFGIYGQPKRENLVVDVEFEIANQATIKSYNIIVDDTNLNPKYIKKGKYFAETHKYDIEFKEFKVSLEDAIKRDINRENPVGEQVIRDFYKRYYENI